jgi:hypothetical protein
MMREKRLRNDRRGLNTALAHALTLSITAILIVGLITATTGFFGSEREDVAREELRTIGNRIASDAMQATSLAARGGATNITTEHPEQVAGTDYSASVRTGSDCKSGTVQAETCLYLETTELDVSLLVPVYNQTEFDVKPERDGAFTVTTLDTGTTTTTTSAPGRVTDVDVTSQVGVGADISQIAAVSLTRPGNQPPAAKFTFSPPSPNAGSSVRFNATASRDPDGSIQEYRWDFDDDGSFEVRTTSPVIDRALPAGREDVTLEVWDGAALGNVTQTVDVSGLAYLDDMNTFDGQDSASFTVRNDFSDSIRIRQVLVDPADDSIGSLDEETGGHEIEVDGDAFGYIEWYDGTSIRNGGEFFHFDDDGDDNSDFVELDPGDTAVVKLRYFSGDVDGKNLTVGLKYELESGGVYTGRTNTTVFTERVGGGPVVAGLQATGDSDSIDISFDASQSLDDITVQVNGGATATLDEGEFTESGTGPYTYNYDLTGLSDGSYTVELTDAESGGTASSDTPLSDTAIVGGGGSGVVWGTPSDWDATTVADGRFVHANFGDHSADRIELGYTRSESGLVSYWPLDDPTGSTAVDVTGGNDGTIKGNPVSTNGIGNSTAYQLEPESGADDYVRIPDSSSLEMGDTDTVTVSAWVNKEESQTGSNWIAIFQHSDQSYNLHFNNGNEPDFTIYDGDYSRADIDNGVENDKWVHLVGTFDGREIAFYKNGNLADTSCQQGGGNGNGNCGNGDIAETDEPAGIGENIEKRDDGDERLLDGKIDEVRLYDRALTASEVETLYDTFEEGTFTTTMKDAGSTLDSDTLQVQYDVDSGPDETVEVKVITESGDESDWITVPDGAGMVGVTGLSTDDDKFRLKVRLSSSASVPTESPTVRKLGVTG